MPLADIHKLIEEQKQDILEATDQTADDIIESYEVLYHVVSQQIQELLIAYQEADSEEKVAILFRRNRLEDLLQEVLERSISFIDQCIEIVNDEFKDAVEIAKQHQEELLQIQVPKKTIESLPKGTIESLENIFRIDRSRFFGMTEQLVDNLRDTLITQVQLQRTNEQIAEEVQKQLNIPLAKALTITRTELFRGYRETKHQTSLANRNILDGWIWHARLNTVTCPICWALHGQRFSVEERQVGHPNCRCSSMPVVKGVPLVVTTGEEAFTKLSIKNKQIILGPKRYEAYKSGVKLQKMIEGSLSGEWNGKIWLLKGLKTLTTS